MATTRFLLGRRGRHLYPLKGAPPAPSLLGRHGVPPPKQKLWSHCKRQPTYAYGFPQVGYKSWASSPVVMITLMLLTGCFVGAYCLVLRIDETLQTSTKSPTSATKIPTSAGVGSYHLRGSSGDTKVTSDTTVTKVQTASSTQRLELQEYLVPLYLNLTVFSIPCDELTVRVVQQQNQTTTTLVFKTILVENHDNFGALTTLRKLTETQKDSNNDSESYSEEEKQEDRMKSNLEEASQRQDRESVAAQEGLDSEEDQERIQKVSANPKEEERQLDQDNDDEEEEDKDGGILDQDNNNPSGVYRQEQEHEENKDAGFDQNHGDQKDSVEDGPPDATDKDTTSGCQVMGHLQLPLGGQGPAIVSVKARSNRVNLSHRVDSLSIGSTHFPKEESLFLNKFKPHTYMDGEHEDVVVVTHRYRVLDNYHFVEHNERVHPHHAAATPEIQLVFALMIPS